MKNKISLLGSMLIFAALFLPVTICAQAKYPQLTFTQTNGNGMYKIGDRVTFTVTAKNGAKLWKEGQLRIIVKQDLIKDLEEKVFDLSKTNPVKISAKFTKPGFITIGVTYIKGKFVRNYWTSCGAGAEPEKIKAGAKIPADLLSFWHGEYAKFKKAVPPNFKLIRIKDSGMSKRYHVIADHLDGKKVYATLAIPRVGKGPFPLMLTVLPAGNWGLACWEYPNTIRMTITVFDRLFKNNKEYSPNYLYAGADKGRKDYFFYKSILGAMRMSDYAKTLPQWDKKNIFAVGQSQGGAFALYMAALDPQITGVVADVPGFCDHNGEKAGHAAGGPQLLKRHPRYAEHANYYDAANFAAFVKCPILMSAGMIDTVCPPASIYSAYNRIKGEKAIYTDPLTGHGTGRKRRMFQMMPMDTFIREQIRKNNAK